jgi:hypothetical protein
MRPIELELQENWTSKSGFPGNFLEMQCATKIRRSIIPSNSNCCEWFVKDYIPLLELSLEAIVSVLRPASISKVRDVLRHSISCLSGQFIDGIFAVFSNLSMTTGQQSAIFPLWFQDLGASFLFQAWNQRTFRLLAHSSRLADISPIACKD